ncbi:30S ribosomal protein 3, chloroplastic [Impatiens glandulifera]|uniref:30S ribosomal protein 3, chloroplastic n=1 Tax=Impatiens glandulifera TaxID=253017 RepID=UPI001FB0D4EA|nr:30S ribosomal protein 3, chloroplastic [Impatiens glandulifera]
MISLSIQPIAGCSYKASTFVSPSREFVAKHPKNSISFSFKASSSRSLTLLDGNTCKRTRKFDTFMVSAVAAETVAEETSVDDSSNQRLGVVVKPTIQKPRLVLKFIWMDNNIGLSLDQVIPGHGTIPLSPYYFWPRKDAWEELKVLLESKPWISQKQMIILLNQATDIINLWQQSGGKLS